VSRSFTGGGALRYAGLVVDSTAIETTPVSLAMWIKRTAISAASEEALFYNGQAGTTNHFIALGINPDNTVFCRTRTTSPANATSTATIADTTNWHLVVGVWAATNSRTIYVDGNAGVTETSTRDPTNTPTRFSLFSNLNNTPTAGLNGYGAYIAVWNVALSSSDVTSLWNGGGGVDPTTIQNASLVGAWDVTGNESPEVDDIGAFDLTVTNGTFSADNPFTVGGGGSGLYNKLHGLFGGKLVGKVA
jgi:hypothetical protein